MFVPVVREPYIYVKFLVVFYKAILWFSFKINKFYERHEDMKE